MIKCQKNLFSIEKDIHYLNCAYMAPILKESEKLAIDAIHRQRTPQFFKPHHFFEITQKIRKQFGNLISSSSENIAIMPSTSYGFASALNNIKTNGKTTITIGNEFPSGYFALKKWTKNNNKTLVVVEQDNLSPQEWNNQIIDKINEDTAVVLISSIHWMNGVKLNLKEIGEKCKKVGAYFIVDGTQSVGAIPINVMELNIDALICAGYKWLFGPYSMALGFFSEKFSDGIPIEESWMNRSNAQNFSELTNYETNYMPHAARYNVGQTTNFILSPIMLNGLEQLNKWGIVNINKYCSLLYDELKELCQNMDISFIDKQDSSQHLFSLGISKNINSKKLKDKLEKKNVFVSLRGEYLRVSLNVFNDSNDLHKLVESIN